MRGTKGARLRSFDARVAQQPVLGDACASVAAGFAGNGRCLQNAGLNPEIGAPNVALSCGGGTGVRRVAAVAPRRFRSTRRVPRPPCRETSESCFTPLP